VVVFLCVSAVRLSVCCIAVRNLKPNCRERLSAQPVQVSVVHEVTTLEQKDNSVHLLPSLFSVAFRIVTGISVSVHGVKALEV
jgi:hypothetical protein